MIIRKMRTRNRIVHGWAFMDLSRREKNAIEKFLITGNTDDLPERFKRKDYSIYD